jgi:hypothetical protein
VSGRPSPIAAPGREAQLAGYGRRLGAFAIDGFFIGLIVVAILIAGGSIEGAGLSSGSASPAPLYLLGAVIVQLGLVATPFVYPAIGWRSGATPAMRLLDLRVVDARSGARLTWGQSLLRTAGWWWSLLTVGIGFAPILGDGWRRGLPDRMASSLVLSLRPLPMSWVPGAYGWVLMPARPPLPPPLIPTARDMTEPPAARASWTWTDAVPVLVTMFPIMFGAGWVATAAAQGLRITAGSSGAVALSYADEIAVYGGSLLLIALLVGWRRHTPLTALGLRLPSWPWLLAGLPLGFAAYVLDVAGGEISSILLPSANSTNQCVGIRDEFNGSLLLTLLAVAVIAPVAEEIIFRGFTFRWLQGRLPLWAAVLVSAAVFSAAHAGWAEPTLFLPVFLDGLLLAFIYSRSSSIWPGVMAHMTINVVGVILILTVAGC